ncbi:hypothetical protein Salat_0502600 [Sesamum alatum]|uniref:Uncharacterized protein n=1 Tax=Sesamum alatum TaxID=300844 RepID=A0AAE2D0N9_9LAMI|nr:hypothetical protein Salat_0502600 [Sesamum alatum]
MGRKRKAIADISAITAEDKTSNAYSEPTTTDEKVHLHTNNINAMEAMNVGNEVQPNSNGIVPLVKKRRQVTPIVVRRSGRLKSSVLCSGSRGAKRVVEYINLVEGEKDEAPHSEQVNTLPNSGGEPHSQQVTTVADSNERNLEEKVDYLIRAVDQFKLQVPRRPNDGPSPDLSYKSLYIESQKQIEALTKANCELVKNLEFAHGQISVVISN